MDVRWDGYQQFGQWRKHPKHAGPRQCAYRLGFDACGAPRLCVEQLAILLEDWWRLGAEQRDRDRHVSQWHSRLRQRFHYQQWMVDWPRRRIRPDSQLDRQSGVGLYRAEQLEFQRHPSGRWICWGQI